jgi:hypothetical protein
MAFKSQLLDVTVCAADSEQPHLAARALEICIDRCDFAEAVLFSHARIPGRFRNVKIGRLRSIKDYSDFCLRLMPSLIHTPYVLVVQWDGYVVDPEAWSPRFREYDYIGAVIHPPSYGSYVGNGGFSLRSRRLLKILPMLPPIPNLEEDRVFCQAYRSVLERKFGIRFAPERVANAFSYESQNPDHPTFGFHGLPNFWRHEEDETIIRLANQMSRNALVSFGFFGLIQSCLGRGRTELASALYAVARKHYDPETIKRLVPNMIPIALVTRSVDLLENTYIAR